MDEFAAAAGRQDSEFELALLVARLLEPELQPQAVDTALRDLLNTMRLPGQTSAADLLQALRVQGFGQHALQQVGVQHSHVGWVLEHKQGLPIALAVVLMACARHYGLNSYGINFPGHFLVQVDDGLVDPLRMQPVTTAQLQDSGLSDAELQQFLQPASPQALGLRMLNNLKANFINQQQWQYALELLDCQLAMTRTDTEMAALLQFERGELWEQIGAVRVAKDAYEACMATATNTELVNKANARIAGLDGIDETLH